MTARMDDITGLFEVKGNPIVIGRYSVAMTTIYDLNCNWSYLKCTSGLGVSGMYPRETGRGDKIRTCDPLLPKQMRYQAAPLPDGQFSVTDQG
jgi:hypothetical protein